MEGHASPHPPFPYIFSLPSLALCDSRCTYSSLLQSLHPHPVPSASVHASTLLTYLISSRGGSSLALKCTTFSEFSSGSVQHTYYTFDGQGVSPDKTAQKLYAWSQAFSPVAVLVPQVPFSLPPLSHPGRGRLLCPFVDLGYFLPVLNTPFVITGRAVSSVLLTTLD